MAVLQNMWLRGAKKKLGGTVLYTQGGRTLQRELAPEVKNPKTPAQMGQRVKWSNLVAFYRANSGWMHKAFENKKATQSDYNKFMSMNAAYSSIYLTKEQASQGACVVDSYSVSDGTLQPVEIFEAEQNWVTNLYITGLRKLDETTTVAAFSTALLGSNAGLRSGDQISFIRVTQLFNNTTDIPYIQVRAYELIINEQDTSLVKDYWPLELVGLGELHETPALMVKNNNNKGGFAIIVSRTQSGRILVSPSQITKVNMSEIIDQYNSSAALAAAVESYGQGDDVFLDSKNASTIVKQPTTLSITEVYSSANVVHAVPGGELDMTNERFGNGFNVAFNKNIDGRVEKVEVYVDSNLTFTDTAPQVEESTVYTTKNAKVETADAERTADIVVTISGVEYEATFTIPSHSMS